MAPAPQAIAGGGVLAEACTKVYATAHGPITALGAVSFDVEAGDFACLTGPSGSGKSTLLHLLAGLDRPTSGRIVVAGRDLGPMGATARARFRIAHIGIVFQVFNLVSNMTALENCMVPMLFAGVPSAAARDRAMELLDRVGLAARARHFPQQLSGGQQQRVAVARALANRPGLVLADEPTGNLDAATGQDLVELLLRLNKEDGVTIISATHDPALLDASNRIWTLRNGRIAHVDAHNPKPNNQAEG